MQLFKKIVNTLIFILIISALLYKYFLYVDLDNQCMIMLMPSHQPSNWNTKEVIKLLKASSPEDYNYMCRKVKTINKNYGCGGFEGGCYYTSKSGTIYIGNDQDNLALTAAVMVHEMCHLRQADTGVTLEEIPCYTAGSEYLEKITVY